MIEISFEETGIMDMRRRRRSEVVLFEFALACELPPGIHEMFLQMLESFSWSMMDMYQFYSEDLGPDENGYGRLKTTPRVSREYPYTVAISIPLDENDELDEIEFSVAQELALEAIEEFRRQGALVWFEPHDYGDNVNQHPDSDRPASTLSSPIVDLATDLPQAEEKPPAWH